MPPWPPNPFVYDRPVEPDDLIDREQEVDRLLGLAEAGQSARVSAPRRFGKTSLLRRVLAGAADLGLTGVYVDLDGAITVQRLGSRIEDAYREQLQGPVARSVVNLVRTLRPRVGVRAPGVTGEVAPTVEEQAERVLERMLDLPKTIFGRTGRRVLVVFDEFQYVLRAGTELDRVFRSRIQHHAAEAAYIFAGSHPGLMAELFGDRERPFYGQAQPLVLDPLEDTPIAEFVAERFERTRRDVGEALEPLLDLARGHPQRAMLLAHHLWEETPSGEAADHDRWTAALDRVDVELDEGFQHLWDRLSAGQQRVLVALAEGQQALYGEQTLTRYGLSKGAVREAEKALRRIGDVERRGRTLVVVDPLLERWLRQTQAGRGRPPSRPT